MLAALVLLWLPTGAFAAGAGAPDDGAAPDAGGAGTDATAEAPAAEGGFPALPARPVVYHEKHVWVPMGDPALGSPYDSIDADPRNPAVLLAATHEGAVYRSADGGSSWVRVVEGRTLGALPDEPDDEAVLLRAEAELEEDAAGGSATDAVGAVDAGVTGRSDGARDAARTAAVFRAADTPVRVWFDPGRAGHALLGRPDGVWRSVDDGATWAVVDPELGATEFYRWRDVLVLGGASGVRASLDGGESFLDLEGATNGATVFQLAEVGPWLYAATSGGLYRSVDGLRWQWVSGAGVDLVRTVVPDPSWPGGLWVAGDGGLRRSDDDGATFYSSGTQPLRGLRRILALDGVGHLLATSSMGVWESTDGGVRWVIASRLLTEPDVRGVTLVGGVPRIATARGLWRMEEPARLAEQEAPPPPRGASRAQVVAIATHRAGLDLNDLALRRVGALARFVPRLELGGSLDTGRDRTTKFLLLQTEEGDDLNWKVYGRICFGGCADSAFGFDLSDVSSLDYVDYAALVDDGILDAGDVDAPDDGGNYVIGGVVYAEAQPVVAAANVAQSAVRYRFQLAEQVGEAWSSRQRLAAEAPLLGDRPLLDQVLHLLSIQELDARLDAWTGGAWTESLQTPEAP